MSTSEHMVQGTSNHGKGKTEHNPTHRVASAEGAWLVCGCVASRRQRPGLLQISLRHGFQWCSRPGGGKAILPSALSCKSSSDRCLSMYCGCLCVTPASTCKLEQPQLKLQSWCSTLRMTATRDWWKTWREGPRELAALRTPQRVRLALRARLELLIPFIGEPQELCSAHRHQDHHPTRSAALSAARCDLRVAILFSSFAGRTCSSMGRQPAGVPSVAQVRMHQACAHTAFTLAKLLYCVQIPGLKRWPFRPAQPRWAQC